MPTQLRVMARALLSSMSATVQAHQLEHDGVRAVPNAIRH